MDGDGGAGGGVSLTNRSSSTSSGGFTACASSTEDAALLPVSMFLAVDKSGSMANDSKWKNVKAAFTSFFEDPTAATLDIALHVFPEGKCSAPACSVVACSQPDIDVGSLSDPAQVTALVDKLDSVSPGGNTPLATALQGAEDWAMSRAMSVGSTEKVVVVLVTDGMPHGCGGKVDEIAAKAKKAYDEAGVLTFAVGLVGSSQATMDLIAQQGQTGQAFFISNSNNAEADFLATLHSIQTQSAPCAYAMPQAGPGEKVDPQLVNVTYQQGSATPDTFDQVTGAAACGAKGGWYYDDPQKPASINLCPATCQEVKADPTAKIQIVLGCATETQ